MDWSRIDNSPAALRGFLESEGLAPKKRWGQNFMISPGARATVVGKLDIRPTDLIWEIGPGLGAITTLLVNAARRVIVFEIDHGIMRVLRNRFGDHLVIVSGDAVKTLPQAAADSDTDLPDIVVGNLPYRAAAAIIAALLEQETISGHCRRMVFTVQREMALRMTALPGKKDYSPLSVLCTLAAEVNLDSDLAGGSFYPAPEVVSSVVSVDPKPVDRALLRMASVCARSLFASRRKTIRNNLPTLGLTTGIQVPRLLDLFRSVGMDISLRAEAVSPEDYLRLADAVISSPGTRPGPDDPTRGEPSARSRQQPRNPNHQAG